jgi:NAD(P)-dependent dehydrogenase (short-subunit alcohol dehydrogenase family)
MGTLKEKVALVTGGTTGIGLASARLFAAEGASVTVTGSNPHTLELARAELRGIADVVASDAGSSADIERLARDIRVRAGGKGGGENDDRKSRGGPVQHHLLQTVRIRCGRAQVGRRAT